MPEFFAEHTPDRDDVDQFTRDYLDCAEWLLDEEIDRSLIQGWSKEAIEQARSDCEDFQEDNADNLAIYSEATGYAGGNDFFLTRNHHGAGFWDRGIGEAGNALTAAAHAFGVADAYLGDDGYLYFL